MNIPGFLNQSAEATTPGCTCADARSSFSAYLDGTLAGRRMQAIAAHMDGCEPCAAQFADWRAMQQALVALGTARVPEDLNLRLRLAVSRERARRIGLRDRIELAWENTVRPLALQVSAGVAACLLLVGSILTLTGVLSPGNPVLANDESLGGQIPARYLYSASTYAAYKPIVTDHTQTIMVQVQIDDHGRVYDYRIVSEEDSPELQAQVQDRLLQMVFTPSRVFGMSVRGHLTMTLAGAPLHGDGTEIASR